MKSHYGNIVRASFMGTTRITLGLKNLYRRSLTTMVGWFENRRSLSFYENVVRNLEDAIIRNALNVAAICAGIEDGVMLQHHLFGDRTTAFDRHRGHIRSILRSLD